MDVNQIGDRGGNVSYSRAALRQAQITGHYNEFQIQNNVQFTVDGRFGTLAPADNQAFSSGHATVSACNEIIYAVVVNANNGIATVAGALVDPAKLGGTGGTAEKVVPWPDMPANNVLVGLIKVKVGTGASFVPGTTNLNATNITATFYDCSRMPTQPLVT